MLLPKEVSGHGKDRVKSIPKADRGIGRRVSQIVLKMSEKFVQSGFGSRLLITVRKIKSRVGIFNRLPKIT